MKDDILGIHPLMWLFFTTSAAYGIGFSILVPLGYVTTSSLYSAMVELAWWLPEIWGGALVAMLSIVGIGETWNKKKLKFAAAFMGFCLWVFAAWSYAIINAPILVLAIAIPNVLSWAWFYLTRVDRHVR